MKRPNIVAVMILAGLCTLAQIGRPAPAEAGLIREIVFYIPDRVFDLLDIFRVRVRVGPGLSAGVRATQLVSGYAGMHSSVFIGPYGPRGARKLPLPAGFEARAGVQASLVDLTDTGTYYDPLEVGAELQLLLLGANVGIGFYEVLDFFTGFVFIDLVGDDFARSPKDDEPEKEFQDNETAETPQDDEPEESPQEEAPEENPQEDETGESPQEG